MTQSPSIFDRHFGAIIGACVSLVAIAVTGAQVWVAHLESASRLDHERQETVRQEARLREEAMRSARIQLATFALDQRDVLLEAGPGPERETMLKVFAATFPADVYEPFLSALSSQVAEGAARQGIEAVRRDVAQQIAPRVFMHIAAESQRARANELASSLETEGWVVPGVEYKATSPSTTQLRVFKQSEVAEAKQIEADLEELGVDVKLVDLSERYGSATNIRARHYELWLGQNY